MQQSCTYGSVRGASGQPVSLPQQNSVGALRRCCYVDVKSQTPRVLFFLMPLCLSRQERLAAMRGTAPGRHTDLKCAL